MEDGKTGVFLYRLERPISLAILGVMEEGIAFLFLCLRRTMIKTKGKPEKRIKIKRKKGQSI